MFSKTYLTGDDGRNNKSEERILASCIFPEKL
jgi:hypothetical protein